MDPEEIRAIRGSLSRAAFARLLGVTPLTVLRWELPEGSKEGRRPRARMIETLRQLAAQGVGAAGGPAGEHDDDETDAEASEPANEAPSVTEVTLPGASANVADEAILMPLLERLGTDAWLSAENQVLSLLSTGELVTNEGRLLATLGIVHAQLFGRFDLRGALTNLLPILEDIERGRVPRTVAARAHVLSSLLFSSPDARFFDPGRVNAHVARAQALLHPDDPEADDLHVYLATAAIYSARFLGPHILMRTFQAHAAALTRAARPLATLLAEALQHLASLVAEAPAAAVRKDEAYLERAGRLRMPYVQVALSLALAQHAINGSATPEEILALVKEAQVRARAAGIAPTEELLRLYRWEIEANIRLGRFGQAESAYGNALDAARRGGLPTYPLVPAACHLFALSSRRADLETLADQLEAQGPPRAGPNHHAFHARATAFFVAGELARAVELIERVCSAPETAPGIDDLRHHAYFGLLVVRVAQGNPEDARVAIERFQAFLAERPSIWYSLVLRRLSGFALFLEGRLAEARQKLESVLPAFRMLGDVTELALTELDLAVVARSSGAADAADRIAAAVARLESLGIPQTLGLQRIARARVHPATWSEQSLCERLVVAMDRLSVRGLRAEHLRDEIEAIVRSLCPGCAVNVRQAKLIAVARDGLDVPDGQGGFLHVTVDGQLGAEQLAALRILEALVPRSAALLAAREFDAASDPSLPNFIAVASATRRLKREIAQLSKSKATILITGESGSGKEVVARGVHDLSSRAEKAYIAFNSASVPRDLFEGQLFGYKKGAFTGATSDNPGVIRAADGGTLFLDEVAELPLETQPKLLRFLENNEILPLGEQKPRRVDVRVLAATHRDLDRCVREGRFREDLYYRLNVVPLSVPPLRERVEDVVPLARAFIERLVPEGQERPELGVDATAALEGHTWPGNVRELRNVIERAMAYAPVPSVLRAEHLRIGYK
jgi:hypothetical protein